MVSHSTLTEHGFHSSLGIATRGAAFLLLSCSLVGFGSQSPEGPTPGSGAMASEGLLHDSTRIEKGVLRQPDSSAPRPRSWMLSWKRRADLRRLRGRQLRQLVQAGFYQVRSPVDGYPLCWSFCLPSLGKGLCAIFPCCAHLC